MMILSTLAPNSFISHLISVQIELGTRRTKYIVLHNYGRTNGNLTADAQVG